jgi:hypothetical protein
MAFSNARALDLSEDHLDFNCLRTAVIRFPPKSTVEHFWWGKQPDSALLLLPWVYAHGDHVNAAVAVRHVNLKEMPNNQIDVMQSRSILICFAGPKSAGLVTRINLL